MRVFLISCLIVGFAVKTTAQSMVKYSKDASEVILKLWNEEALSQDDSIQFAEFLKFNKQIKTPDCGILDTTYLSCPTGNTLVLNYLNVKLKWNSFNKGAAKLPFKKVVKQNLKSLPSRYELLYFYYNTIFSHVLNNQKFMDHHSLNINLSDLGLENETEQVIVFLGAMRHLGRQIKAYSENHFPDNCFRAVSFVNRLPLFNGLEFYDFTLPPFDDFNIEVDKTKPKTSYTTYMMSYFEEAKMAYPPCLEHETKKTD